MDPVFPSHNFTSGHVLEAAIFDNTSRHDALLTSFLCVVKASVQLVTFFAAYEYIATICTHKMDLNLLLVFIVGFLSHGVFCGEFTFELPDNEKMCFHEVIEKGVESTLEFQVNFYLFFDTLHFKHS